MDRPIEEPMSKRQQDKKIRAGARALRRKPGWDPSALQKQSPGEQLRELAQSERTEDSYREATSCEACSEEQQRLEDETALCPKHLSEAMGL